MLPTYKVAVNFEWTSKCNARCIMCPQDMIEHPQLMMADTFYKALERINTDDVFRTVIAGYGEPTTHPPIHGVCLRYWKSSRSF